MKITKADFRGYKTELSIGEAIIYATIPSAYSYDGQLEKLQYENENLRELVARLVESMYSNEKRGNRDNERLEYILGYGFEVTE